MNSKGKLIVAIVFLLAMGGCESKGKGTDFFHPIKDRITAMSEEELLDQFKRVDIINEKRSDELINVSKKMRIEISGKSHLSAGTR